MLILKSTPEMVQFGDACASGGRGRICSFGSAQIRPPKSILVGLSRSAYHCCYIEYLGLHNLVSITKILVGISSIPSILVGISWSAYPIRHIMLGIS